jgi:hypothetical protein
MTLDPDHEGIISHRFVLIQRKTLFRGLLRPANDATGSDWVHVANKTNLRRLEKKLFAAGWKFFYGATTIRAIGFGFDRPRK